MALGLGRLGSTLLRVLLSLLLLGLLLYLFRDKLGDVLALLSHVKALPLAMAFLWYLFFILVSAWRWRLLLNARGLRFSTWYLVRVFTLSLFFCKLLPTSIGGDVFRIAYTAPPGRSADALSATLLDRLVGFVSLLLMAVVVSIWLFVASPGARSLEIPVAGVNLRGFGIILLLSSGLVALVLLTLVLFNDTAHRMSLRVFGRVRFLRLGERLDRTYDAVKKYRHQPRVLLLSVLSGIGVQVGLVMTWYSAAAALAGTVPVIYYFVLIPLLNIVINIPTIGGLGVREWAFVLLFTPGWLAGHLTEQTALASALLFLALDLVFALTGGVLFAVMRRNTEGAQQTDSRKEDGHAADPQIEH